jgi:hypothetical protein
MYFMEKKIALVGLYLNEIKIYNELIAINYKNLLLFKNFEDYYILHPFG